MWGVWGVWVLGYISDCANCSLQHTLNHSKMFQISPKDMRSQHLTGEELFQHGGAASRSTRQKSSFNHLWLRKPCNQQGVAFPWRGVFGLLPVNNNVGKS